MVPRGARCARDSFRPRCWSPPRSRTNDIVGRVSTREERSYQRRRPRPVASIFGHTRSIQAAACYELTMEVHAHHYSAIASRMNQMKCFPGDKIVRVSKYLTFMLDRDGAGILARPVTSWEPRVSTSLAPRALASPIIGKVSANSSVQRLAGEKSDEESGAW